MQVNDKTTDQLIQQYAQSLDKPVSLGITSTQDTSNSVRQGQQKGEYEAPVAEYGDLTELNTSRIILDSVGRELLIEIAIDYLNLLGTSTAVYERNGDYALGIFASGWCRFLDQGSRNLCETDDNREALKCGKWVCHESCWKSASLAAIESGKPVDIPCAGGLRLYAVPIWAGEDIVGAINFGYGDLKKDDDSLLEIAARYGVDLNELRKRAKEHPSNSPLLEGIAQGMLHTAAKLIGEIVHRTQTEKELREREEQFRETFEQAAVGIAHVGTDGRWLEINQRYCDIVGYSREEMLTRTFQAITHPEDLDTDLEFARRMLKGEIQTYSMEKRYLRKDQSVAWVNLTVSLARKETGEPRYFIAVIEDISSRKQVEDELDTMLNQSSDLFCIVSADGLFKYVNPAWTEVLGFTEDELLDKPFQDFAYPEDRDKNTAEVKKLMRGERTIDYDNRYVSKDGSVRTISWTASSQTERGLIYCVGRDVTERKHAEEHRQKLEAQLRQAQKLDAVGTLAAGVAHDFNNALVAVFGHAEIARLALPPGHKVIEDIDGILKAGEHASAVAKSLLLFSREAATEMVPMNLGKIISNTTRMLERMLPATIELSGDVDESRSSCIHGDNQQISQVLMNLAVNARDAMPDGGRLHIGVSSRMVDCSSRKVCLVVKDTGVGMSQEVQSRIFDPFYSTKERGKGSGLGMAVVHGIVESHHGSIQVDSQQGKGTVVRIEFPGCEPSECQEGCQTREPVQRGDGMTVLIAEDNKQVRQIVEKTLTSIGYDVISTEDGEEALTVIDADERSLDLAILDLDMPRKTGMECLMDLRKRNPDFPVILMSGFHDSRLTENDLLGAHLLTKPFQVGELRQLVTKVLEAKRTPASKT